MRKATVFLFNLSEMDMQHTQSSCFNMVFTAVFKALFVKTGSEAGSVGVKQLEDYTQSSVMQELITPASTSVKEMHCCDACESSAIYICHVFQNVTERIN